MRRPRQKLTVNTFPFLAVLLCAMGSLVFLLLVMDRRAKIVARNRALEAIQARQGQSSERVRQAEAARQADWQRQRDNLRQTLLKQHRELREHLEGLIGESASAGKLVEKHQAGYRAL